MTFETPILTDRGQRALNCHGRSVAYKDREELADALEDANFPVFQPVVDSFYHFGGFWIPIGLNGTFRIYSLRDAIAASQFDDSYSGEPNNFRIVFGDHPYAQMWFLMDGYGVLYADDTPVCEDIACWIEQNAMMELVEKWKNCVRIVLPDQSVKLIDDWAEHKMKRVSAASDQFSTWWLGEEAALRKFASWGGETDDPKTIWLFTTSVEKAKCLVDEIERDFGLTAEDIRAWPP